MRQLDFHRTPTVVRHARQGGKIDGFPRVSRLLVHSKKLDGVLNQFGFVGLGRQPGDRLLRHWNKKANTYGRSNYGIDRINNFTVQKRNGLHQGLCKVLQHGRRALPQCMGSQNLQRKMRHAARHAGFGGALLERGASHVSEWSQVGRTDAPRLQLCGMRIETTVALEMGQEPSENARALLKEPLPVSQGESLLRLQGRNRGHEQANFVSVQNQKMRKKGLHDDVARELKAQKKELAEIRQTQTVILGTLRQLVHNFEPKAKRQRVADVLTAQGSCRVEFPTQCCCWFETVRTRTASGVKDEEGKRDVRAM